MALRTSVADGNWSAAGTWDTGVPLNADTVIVAGGHTVTFDVDQSGFANGVDLTITGTLVCSTAAGAYYLMCSADIDGAGDFNAGSAGTPLPSSVTFTIDFNGAANSIEGGGGLTVNFYCSEPTNRYIRLSAAEAAGQTALSVDTDVTGDIWADGDMIHIDDVDEGRDSEERTIAAGGIAAGEITVTVGLANAKIEGALIILITRNIRIVNSTDYAFRAGIGNYVRCEIRTKYCQYYGVGHEFAGAISTTSFAFNLMSDSIISGIVSGNNSHAMSACANCAIFGLISGVQYHGVETSYGCIISGLISGCGGAGIDQGSGNQLTGTIHGCKYGLYYGRGHRISGVISGCQYGLYYAAALLDNCVLGRQADGTLDINSSADIYRSFVDGDNVILASTVKVATGYGADVSIRNYGHVAQTGLLAGFPDVNNDTPGIYHEWQHEGEIETVSHVDGRRLTTPTNICDADHVLDADLPRIPAAGGDTIAVTCTVTVNAPQPADSVTLVIDPDGLYGGPVASVQPTPQDTQTTLTAELTIDAGTYGALVPVEIQVDDYAAGGEVTIDAATMGRTGHPTANLVLERWSWQQISLPVSIMARVTAPTIRAEII